MTDEVLLSFSKNRCFIFLKKCVTMVIVKVIGQHVRLSPGIGVTLRNSAYPDEMQHFI